MLRCMIAEDYEEGCCASVYLPDGEKKRFHLNHFLPPKMKPYIGWEMDADVPGWGVKNIRALGSETSLECDDEQLKAEVERLRAFCKEFVWGEDNPHEHQLLEEERNELLIEKVELVCERDDLKAEVERLETELNAKTERSGGWSDDPVTCCRCGQARLAKNAFKPDIYKDEWMCWLCAGKHYRGMDRLLEQERVRVKELEAEVERLKATSRQSIKNRPMVGIGSVDE